jgi:hypothetical protein
VSYTLAITTKKARALTSTANVSHVQCQTKQQDWVTTSGGPPPPSHCTAVFTTMMPYVVCP